MAKIFRINRDAGRNIINILDKDGHVLKKIVVKENLQRALKLLKKINSLKTVNGIPVYKTKMLDNVSTWAFHQHVIFWNHLRCYVRYEEIIKFFQNNKNGKIVISQDLMDLKKLLKKSGIKVDNNRKFFSVKLKSRLLCLSTRYLALLITFLAVLKIIFFKFHLLIYTPDKFSEKHKCDFRLYPVYNYVRRKNISYIEIFHTLLGKQFLKNLFKRRRAAIYLESFPLNFIRNKLNIKNFDLSSIEPHNRSYITYLLKLIDKRAQQSIKRIKILSFLLKLSNIKILVALDDVRYTNELIVACKLNNIKTFGFQHGDFTKYHVGYMNYKIPPTHSITFDKLFVWNKYWKKLLLLSSNQYNKDNVKIGGWLRKPKEIFYDKRKNKIESFSRLNLLVPYEIMAPKQEVCRYIRRFCRLGANIFFKVRPDIAYSKQLKEYGLSSRDVVLIKDINRQVLSTIDAVIGVYSMFLNEMLFYDKPVFILETSSDLGYPLIDNGLAVSLGKNFNTKLIMDYINNYQSKKNIVWPKTCDIKKTFRKIIQ